MNNEYSFSKTVNIFINRLKKHNDCIEVIKVNDKETIIMYEDWEHEPIINFTSNAKRARKIASMLGGNNPMSNPETVTKSQQIKKGRRDAKNNKI